MDEVLDIYVNSVQVNASLYEFLLTCSLITPRKDGERLSQERVRIRTSPQHAKAMSILLSKHLGKFEELFSPIELPATLIEYLMRDEHAAGSDEKDGEE